MRSDPAEKLKGIIADIIYQNDETGFKICELETETDTAVIKGILPFVSVGERVLLEGTWSVHDVYGEQFNVTDFVKEIPRKPDEMEFFLASGLIDGVGNATARLIVNAFGEDTYDVLTDHPEKLEALKGITHNRAQKISAAFREHFLMSDIVMFMGRFGAGTKLAVKAYKLYGENAVRVISEDPYILSEDMPE